MFKCLKVLLITPQTTQAKLNCANFTHHQILISYLPNMYIYTAALMLLVNSDALQLPLPKSLKLKFSESIKAVQPIVNILPLMIVPIAASAAESKGKLEYQPALQGLDYGKPRTFYPDYVQKPSGLQYKVVKEGTGPTPVPGDRVVIDWEGYTIGYYGRPFQTRNKVKGGAFDATESDNLRWVVNSGAVVAALDEAIQYLKEGSVAQVIVPAELGYPSSGDSEHDLVGPKPSTFSGMRALNFVLDNQNLIDKTLLINVRLVRVDKDFSVKKGNKSKTS